MQDGPFANFTVNLGPGTDVSGNPRCLQRDFSPLFANQNSEQKFVDDVLGRTDFASMAWTIDGESGPQPTGAPLHNIHAGGHFSVGGSLGTMGDPPVASSGMLNSARLQVKRDLTILARTPILAPPRQS